MRGLDSARVAVLLRGTVALSLCFCAVSATAQNGQTDIAVDRNTVLLVSPDEPMPVRHAVEDLAADMTKVFGAMPQSTTDAQHAGAVALVIGKDQLPGVARPPGKDPAPESFSITTGIARIAGHRTQVVRLAGSDLRGTLYAIYEFSQRYLGVDPMYYWTDHEPEKRSVVRVPAALHQSFPGPVFRYRGIFTNDEDLLTGWAPGEAKDGTGISLAVWNKIYETILRLKGNMVVAGTWPFPNEAQDRLAAERGLLLNQHHAEPLGVNFSRWPQDVPYNLTAHPEFIENAWRNAVAAYPADQEILWELGLRGLSDQPYSALDASVRDNEKAQGRVISKAIADQIRIVQAKYPKAVFITDLWMEGAKLMRSGDLVIPPNVITVWPDTGYGDMQDGGQVHAGEGAYVHVAMFNRRANQLSELTPVDRMFSSLKRFQRAGATSFLLVNTSDIRPVTMGTRAVLDFGWKGAALGSSDAYYGDWSATEFGAGAAPLVAQVLKAYFAAPAEVAGTSPTPYGDSYYHYTAREMLRHAMIQWPVYGLPDQAPVWKAPYVGRVPFDPQAALTAAERELKACGEARSRWDAVWTQAQAASRSVEADRRAFYQASVLTMIEINRESNLMLYYASAATVALHNGDRTAASQQIALALQALDAIKHAESLAEYGKWQHWYRGDWLTGVDHTRDVAMQFASYLRDPSGPMQPPVEWSAWEAYYWIQHYQGTRTVDVQSR